MASVRAQGSASHGWLWSFAVNCGLVVSGAMLGVMARKWARDEPELTQQSCAKCKWKVCVGIGVIAVDAESKKFLVGCRKGSHGSGQWALPGGWLERGEEFATCGLRELEEETGLGKEHLEDGAVVLNMAPSNNKEFGTVSVFVLVKVKKGCAKDVRICEPDKCHAWKWVSKRDDLDSASVLFYPLEYLFKNYPSELEILIGQGTY